MSFAQSFTSFRKETLLQVLFKSLPASSLDFTQPSDINIPYIIYIYIIALLYWAGPLLHERFSLLLKGTSIRPRMESSHQISRVWIDAVTSTGESEKPSIVLDSFSNCLCTHKISHECINFRVKTSR